MRQRMLGKEKYKEMLIILVSVFLLLLVMLVVGEESCYDQSCEESGPHLPPPDQCSAPGCCQDWCLCFLGEALYHRSVELSLTSLQVCPQV